MHKKNWASKKALTIQNISLPTPGITHRSKETKQPPCTPSTESQIIPLSQGGEKKRNRKGGQKLAGWTKNHIKSKNCLKRQFLNYFVLALISEDNLFKISYLPLLAVHTLLKAKQQGEYTLTENLYLSNECKLASKKIYIYDIII